MTGIVEMFIKVFRIIQTLFSIHWLSNRPSPTKENSVTVSRSSNMKVSFHIVFCTF